MTANTSKPGCFGRIGMIMTGIISLLGVVASCMGIIQFFDRPASTPVDPSGSSGGLAYTSEPVVDIPVIEYPTDSNLIYANQTTITPELRQNVESFLGNAAATEALAYFYGDASYASMFSGDALLALQTQIQDLNARGIYVDARFDYDNSYIQDIRVPQENRIEVDSCEYWTNDVYDRQTGTLINAGTPTLVPQTIVIEYLNDNFYITSIAFYTGQSFCS